MTIPSQVTLLPKDARHNSVQGYLGTLAFNKDNAPSPPENTVIQLAAAANTVTPLTDAGTNSFFLYPGDCYELSVVFPGAGNGSTMILQLAFGDATDPVAGDFPAVPAAAGLANSTRFLTWALFWSTDPFRFKALPGQRRLVVKNPVAFAAAPTIMLRRMS